MNIIDSAANTIFNDEVKDLSMDILEVCIDTILDNDILKELPFVKTVHAVAKTSISIKERFLVKKFLYFINGFQSHTIEQKEVDKRKLAIKNNEKWIYKEIEYIVIYLDNIDSTTKSKLLGILYNEYLNGKFDWEKFCQLIEIVNKMLSYDIPLFVEFYKHCTSTLDKNKGFYYDLTSYSRLTGLGLIEKDFDYGQDFSKYGNVFSEGAYVYRITYSGKILGKICCEL